MPRSLPVSACLAAALAACAPGTPVATPAPAAPAPLAAAEVDATLFLVGDAGAPAREGEPVLAALAEALRGAAGQRVLVFLGDNVYPSGIPPADTDGRAEAERRLRAQVDVGVTTGATTYLIPGNHDWRGGGLATLRRQEALVAEWTGGRARMVPGGGCPGPVAVDVSPTLRLVALDTEWWLTEPAGRPDPATCDAGADTAVTRQLRADLAGAGDRRTVVVGHHPLVSGGKHGGHFGVEDHLFPLRSVASWLWLPLPIIGSAMPVARQHGITVQDVSHGKYRHLADALRAVFADAPPLLYAAGHDHGLQVIAPADGPVLAVSGGGIYGHTERVARLDDTRYGASEAGFMRVTFLRDGRVLLEVVRAGADGRGTVAYRQWLAEGGRP